jgi:tetratricopeptide (TPR) repeat protein
METHGEEHVVYASCLNNTALMQKLLGFNDSAMDKYVKALHIYEDKVGKKHKSYVSTLANLGVLYKAIAETSTGLDKLQLIERSEEALLDSIRIRIEISSFDNKDVLVASNHLATLWRMSKREEKAEEKLREILVIARNKYGDK